MTTVEDHKKTEEDRAFEQFEKLSLLLQRLLLYVDKYTAKIAIHNDYEHYLARKPDQTIVKLLFDQFSSALGSIPVLRRDEIFAKFEVVKVPMLTRFIVPEDTSADIYLIVQGKALQIEVEAKDP